MPSSNACCFLFLADDVKDQINVGLSTRFSATNLTLIAAQHYYFTVIAYNDVGLRTVLSSDGFIVDLDGPNTGMVYNTDRNRNYALQSATSTFDLTWHGFIDLESGVKGYYVALFEDTEVDTVVQEFTYVSIQTSVKLTNLSLMHGKRYFGAVKAINTGDIFSDIVISESKLIDATPPLAYTCAVLSPIYESVTQISKSTSLMFSANFEDEILYVFSGRLDRSDVNPQLQLQLGQTIGTLLPIEESHDGGLRFSYSFQSSVVGIHNVTFVTESLDKINFTVALHKCNLSDVSNTDEGLVVTQLSSGSFKISFRVMDRESGIKGVSKY